MRPDSDNKPPKLAERLLTWLIRDDLAEEVLGDLEEKFYAVAESQSPFRAKLNYWYQVLNYLRPFAVRKGKVGGLISYGIFQNYLIGSVRIMLKQRLYSIIIILSLGLGLSFVNVLVTYLYQESTVDDFHVRKDQIFRLLSDDPFKESNKISFILEKASAYLFSNYPEIEAGCRLFSPESVTVIDNAANELNDVTVLATDTSFFHLFDFLSSGSDRFSIKKNGIVLSAGLSNKLFGTENPIGKTVRIKIDSAEKPLQVTGVFKHPAQGSHLQFDALVHYPDYQNKHTGALTYVLLKNGTNPEALQKKLSDDQQMPSLFGPGTASYYFQPLKEIYFDTGNDRSFSQAVSAKLIWVGWSVSFLILTLTVFNFISLFLLTSVRRRKEMGIKRILGTNASSLALAVLIDVFLFISIAYFLSLFFTFYILPWFSQSFNAKTSFSDIFNPQVIKIYLGILVAFGILATAFITARISNFQPVRVITSVCDVKIKLNKFLLTPQFIISITLALCAATIVQQVRFIKNKPLGFNRKLMEIKAPNDLLNHKLEALKTSLLSSAIIKNACLASGNPISGNWMAGYELENKEIFTPYLLSGDEDLIKTYGLEIIQANTTRSNSHFVNEALLKRFNLEDPLGKTIPGTDFKIDGVVKDFNMVSFRQQIPPTIITIKNRAYPKLLVNYSTASNVLEEIKAHWKTIFPGYGFNYKLVEDELAQKHEEDLKLLKIITSFSIAGILIACFGLFALAWGVIQNRTKEIGIRKVIGASMFSIIRILSFDFMKWIALAFLISVPVSYLIMNSWLQNFAYRISIGPLMIGSVGIAVLAISVVIVGFQAIRAANINPVEMLRDE